MTKTPYTELDFAPLKENLKNYLKSQSRFKDYDFEGSNMNVLLDVLAYNTMLNNLYSNMTFSEAFLDSAQLRDSVVSRAKELNYLPRSRVSSRAYVNLTLHPNVPTNYLSIPAGTEFIGKAGSRSFTFVTHEAVEAEAEGAIFTAKNVEIFEGYMKTEMLKASRLKTQVYELTEPNIDIDSIRVSVRTNANINSEKVEYTRKNDIFGVRPDHTVFYVQPVSGERYGITFGDDIFGVEPKFGNVIEVTYRVTNGKSANGIYNFSTGNVVSNSVVFVQTARDTNGAVIRSSGGAERETNEEIKYYAPKSIQIQDRAITESDYEILLRNKFPEIQAVSVYGGEELYPPRYGRVVISVDVAGSDGVSVNNKEKYEDFLKDRAPIGIEPLVVSPKFMHLGLSVDVKYDISKTTKSMSEIKATVLNKILAYNTKYLNDFRIAFRYSNLVSEIDEADTTIVSNDTEVRAIIPINPRIGVSMNESFQFRNELEVTAAVGAIRSSVFQTKGLGGCYILDDRKGNLNVLRNNSGVTEYVIRNVGTVDYKTGLVIIQNLIIESHEGEDLRIYGSVKSADIDAPKDRILSIRPQDIKITVTGVKL